MDNLAGIGKWIKDACHPQPTPLKTQAESLRGLDSGESGSQNDREMHGHGLRFAEFHGSHQEAVNLLKDPHRP